jgi:hypothetical protein
MTNAAHTEVTYGRRGMQDGGDQKTGKQVAQRPGSYPSSMLNQPQLQAIYLLLVALVVVVSIVWRAGNLNAFSLSNDEGAYLMWAWLVHSGHPLYSETVSVSAPCFIVALDWAFELAGVSLATGRALVLVFMGLALISLAWTGKLLHSWLAGLLAAVIFSLAPSAFLLSRMAIGEIPSVALTSLAVALALTYWRHGGKKWLALSGLALSLSLLMKAMNPLAAVLILWLIVARHWHSPRRWSAIATAAAMWGLAGLLPVLLSLLMYDPAAFYDQAVVFRFDLRVAFPWHLTDNVTQLGLFFKQHWGIIGLALTGVVLLVHRARWKTLVPLGLWLAVNILSVLFHSPLFFHHIVILLPPLAVLAGIGFAETASLLRERRWVWGTLGLIGVVVFLLALPGAIQANQTARAASFGREAEAIAFLEQVTYPTDNIISDNLLLPFMAGRQTPPPLGDVAQVAINSGRQTSERLIAISEAYPVEAVANWALRLPYLDEYMAWVESNYLVKQVWDDHHIIYVGRRTSEDQVPNRIDAQVGDSIDLLGYAIEDSKPEERGKLHPRADKAQELNVTLFWQADSPVNENYHVFVQLLDPEGRLVTQHDGQPLHGYLPTGDWPPNDVIPDRHRLLLPDDLPYGHYQLIAGMYLPETMERLPVYTAHRQGTSDNVTLTQLEIGN